VIFRIQCATGWDFTDIHTGKAFHTFELDVRAVAARPLPTLARQNGNVLDSVAVVNRYVLLLKPGFVARLSFGHCLITTFHLLRLKIISRRDSLGELIVLLIP
jgi:hypothetical protein